MLQFLKTARILTAVVAGLVLLSVVYGFVVIGSPREQRLKRLDMQRVTDLQNIEQQISWYFQKEGRLPSSLDDLTRIDAWYVVPSDPETGEPYSYKVQDSVTFELCAVFATSNREVETRGSVRPIPYITAYVHDQGKQCFERTVAGASKEAIPTSAEW